MPSKTSATSRDVGAELSFLTRALKAPSLREAVPRLAERARAESWTHEEFLAACLQREVAAWDAHGVEGRIRAARFLARRALEEFDFDHARGLSREVIAHLGTLDFITAKGNVVFLGPPGTGKTHLATGIAIRACQAGHRVLFATDSEWVDRLDGTHHDGRLQDELRLLGRYPRLVVDEVAPGGPCTAAPAPRLVPDVSRPSGPGPGDDFAGSGGVLVPGHGQARVAASGRGGRFCSPLNVAWIRDRSK